MKFLLLITVILTFYIFSKRHKKNKSLGQLSFIKRFRKKLTSKDHIRQKLKQGFFDEMMLDPNSDITIKHWEKETEILAKAEIHRARLNKYGQSKMNGEMFYMGTKESVYKYNNDGEKQYV